MRRLAELPVVPSEANFVLLPLESREAAATLDRINSIYPVRDEELHRHLGGLWFGQGNFAGAIREDAAAA